MTPSRTSKGRSLLDPFLTLALLPVLATLGCGSQNATAEPAGSVESGAGAGADSGMESRADRQESQPTEGGKPPVQVVEVVKSYPHDERAYTQGLVFADGRLLEGTGRLRESSLREVRLETGEVLRKVALSSEFFGEGLALHNNELYQLTWKSGRVFVYNRQSFELTGERRLQGEGWGLVSDGTHLIISNGTNLIRFLDPKTFEEVRRVFVTANGVPVSQLNELEMVEGELYANVWKSNSIVRIDPKDGHVLGVLDLAGIIDFPPIRDTDAVLNGIAYDTKKKRLFVTGKLWPKVYEIRIKQD